MLEAFRGYQARHGPVRDRVVRASDYRHALRPLPLPGAFKKLIAWLRAKGVDGEKPLHTLRKEFGSLIAQQFGIYAAKEILGHADIATTAGHYLEVKVKPMSGLGHLLPPAAQNVIPFAKEEKPKKLRGRAQEL